MKKSIIYLSALALGVVGAMSVTSCDDNFERPPMVMPNATIEANTTIADFKAEFFVSGSNYANLVGTKADGSHYIIEGYVSTSDQEGNYFKQLVIQDATGAIQLDIDAYDLYLSYQVGQKLVLDVTGLYVGTYGRLLQIGAAPTSGYPSRISEDVFAQHAQLDGLANSETMVQPEVFSLSDLSTTSPDSPTGLEWQNRLIKIENVKFANAGTQTLSTSGSNGVSQTFSNSEGSAILYTSGYSTFWNYYCPVGTGDVVGILSCYNATWQIRLIDISGLQNFDYLGLEPGDGGTGGDGDDDNNGGDSGAGTKETPYSVADVQAGATGTDVWVKGYIVGWIDGMTMSSGARFDATDVSVATNILLGSSPSVTSVDNCIPVQLPAGEVRSALNLQNNPGNLGKEVLLCGNLENYFGAKGLKSVNDYVLDGQDNGGSGDSGSTSGDPLTSLDQNFEGGTIPAGWTQVQLAGNKKWYVTSYSGNYYASMTGYQGTAPFDSWFITPALDLSAMANKVLTFDTEVNGYGSTTSVFEVYVLTSADPATATKTQLNVALPVAPASGYSDWMPSGKIDLSSFSGTVYIGFRYAATADANYATWCLDNVVVN